MNGLAKRSIDVYHPQFTANFQPIDDPDATPPLIVFLPTSLFLIAFPIFAHVLSPAFGLVSCILITALVAVFARALVPIILVAAFLFQNTFVAMVVPLFSNEGVFDTIRAYNFVITVVSWGSVLGLLAVRRSAWDPALSWIMAVTSAAIICIILYFVYGYALNGTSALVYLRNLVTPLLCFQTCLIIAIDRRSDIKPALVFFGVVAVIYGYFELLYGLKFLTLFNGDDYMMLRMKEWLHSGDWLRDSKETGRIIRSLEDFLTVEMFNTPLLSDFKIYLQRLQGPNFHPVSYGYAVSIFTLITLIMRKYWFAILALPILVFVGSKGSVILIIFSLPAVYAARRFGARTAMIGLAAMLPIYVTIAMLVGYSIRDYHVLGFLGGIDGFVGNPFGHGLGSGGNLSTAIDRAAWDRAQLLGQTSIAVESAVGVLLYQMGVASGVVLAAYMLIARKASQLLRFVWSDLLAFSSVGSIVLIANGFLQEEALFSPLALAFVMIILGHSMGLALGEVRRSRFGPRN